VGTIRDELRSRDGFFAKLFKAAHLNVGGGSVAVGAATALANFTFDVQSRPQLLDMGTVTVFMACSEADNVAGACAAFQRKIWNRNGVLYYRPSCIRQSAGQLRSGRKGAIGDERQVGFCSSFTALSPPMRVFNF
jgi:hypothetical protein